MNLDVSIVIVNYKTPELTCACIKSIKDYTQGLTYEIIIIDNNSNDGSVDIIQKKFTDVNVIAHNDNAGTSIAYNIGINAAKGKYILIQNSDTQYFENSIRIALDEYKKFEQIEKVGLLACQIKGFDGVIQYNSNLSFLGFKHYLRSNPIAINLNIFQSSFSNEERLLLHQKEHNPAWLGIPFGLFNKEICSKHNLYFDQDIFMYYDDEEWCYRLNQNGFTHKFITKTAILHVNGASSEDFSEWRFGQITVSRLLHILKTKGKLGYIALGFILLFNYIFFQLLNNRVKDTKTISSEALELLIVKKYYFKVLSFSKRTSKNLNYLKFDVNTKLI